MIKKTITYSDYNGKERTEDFYFNFNKAELMEMEFSQTGGFTTFLEKVVAEQDPNQMMTLFKDLVLRSYGVKSEDGKRFIKNAQVRDEFAQTEAYSQLFMELATDAVAAAAFVNGVASVDVAKPGLLPAT